MHAENFDAAPCVGLLFDESDPGQAAETLSQVAAELARFGLTAAEPQAFSPDSAPHHAGVGVGFGQRFLVVACADPALARALAAGTPLPVLRVPILPTVSGGNPLDVLWPEPPEGDDGGYATLAIGEAGARNAALFVVSVLALGDDGLRERWRAFRRTQTETVLAAALPPV